MGLPSLVLTELQLLWLTSGPQGFLLTPSPSLFKLTLNLSSSFSLMWLQGLSCLGSPLDSLVFPLSACLSGNTSLLLIIPLIATTKDKPNVSFHEMR